MFDMDRDNIEIYEWDDCNLEYFYCGRKKNPIPTLYHIEPKSIEELRAKACEVAGIDLSELDISPKEPEVIGIVGSPIPFEAVYPTIPPDIATKIKHNPWLYLNEHPEHKAIPLNQL